MKGLDKEIVNELTNQGAKLVRFADICEKQVLKNKIWSPSTSRDEIVDVYGCSTCIKCLVHCPRTQRYMKGGNTNG